MRSNMSLSKKHSRQVIGYVTQYDAWKDIPGLVPKGGYNQLNIDFSKYTILNFSFFGLAMDGSLHSADHRNKNIHLPEVNQEPAELIYQDVYSSWDRYILFGDQLVLYYISEGSLAYQEGYRNDGGGWINIHTQEKGMFPLAISNPDGPPGLLKKAKAYGVKVMASLGGWSMSKHFPAVAADAQKRKRLVADCRKLIDMGFDGIDLDWEFPGGAGMNIIDFSAADYRNFTLLVEDIRREIGDGYLITAATSTANRLLAGFEWPRLQQIMDYFNIMTYDVNGGWSDIAGHNSPLYNYPGQENGELAASLDKTIRFLLDQGVAASKINAGVAFYGRGVITEGPAALNAKTVKTTANVPPDGVINTCGDFVNWPLNVCDGTPNYAMIVQKTQEGEYGGWQYHWDEHARVPYLTKDNYFLSYDNERSVAEKARYVEEKNLAGVIIWTAYGDLQDLTTHTTTHGNKLVECHNATSVLVDTLHEVFTSGGGVEDSYLSVNVISPTDNDVFHTLQGIRLHAVVRAKNVEINQVYFKTGNGVIPAISSVRKNGFLEEVYYSAYLSGANAGSHRLVAVVVDGKGKEYASAEVTFYVTEKETPPLPDDPIVPEQPPIVITPPVLVLREVTSDKVALVWERAARSDIVFDLHRDNKVIAAGLTGDTYIDRDVIPGGRYSYVVLARDAQGNSALSNTLTVAVNTAPVEGGGGQFPDLSNKRVVMGFWHNWPQNAYNGSGYQQGFFKEMQLDDIPQAYNVIAVAFMKVAEHNNDRIPDFSPYNCTTAEFRRQVDVLHAQGRAVLISLGGADAHIELQRGDEDALATRIIHLADTYGFDGLDIDLEQAAIIAKDNQTVIPATLKRVKDHYRSKGSNFIISMAPEFPYLREGNSYTPYITSLEGYYDFIAPQYYNQGGDGIWVDEANGGKGAWITQNNDAMKEDFLYYLTESLVTGTRGYIRIPSSKFIIGLPSNVDAAATGYVVDPAVVGNVFKRLDAKGIPIKGLMTWSVNWDAGRTKGGREYQWEFIRRYGWISGGALPDEPVVPEPEEPVVPVPQGLHVVSQTQNEVVLSWKEEGAGTLVWGYTLYRDGQPVQSVTAPPYTDKGLMPARQYRYQVLAMSAQGGESPLSASVIAQTEPEKNEDPSWRAEGWYADDSVVLFEGRRYRCVMQHTANRYWTPVKATSLWQRL